MIYDEFSDIPCKQRRYQLRKQKENKCVTCGQPCKTKFYCELHAALVSTNLKIKARTDLRIRAREIVGNAIARGELVRQKCEQCNRMGEAHHDDYTKPLEVRWLCKIHHQNHHRNFQVHAK